MINHNPIEFINKFMAAMLFFENHVFVVTENVAEIRPENEASSRISSSPITTLAVKTVNVKQILTLVGAAIN